MNYAVSSGLRIGSFKSPPAYRGNTYHGCRAKTPIFYSAFWAIVAELSVPASRLRDPQHTRIFMGAPQLPVNLRGISATPNRLRQLRPYPGGPIKRPAFATALAPTSRTIKPP